MSHFFLHSVIAGVDLLLTNLRQAEWREGAVWNTTKSSLLHPNPRLIYFSISFAQTGFENDLRIQTSQGLCSHYLMLIWQLKV